MGKSWCVSSLPASSVAATSTRYYCRMTLLRRILISASCSYSVGSVMNVNTLSTASWTEWLMHRMWLTLRISDEGID
ncbi:unnamed protein product [Sphagnum jensenii]|uniref:Secreted protein n=1 Tax=Sphagnum jensenii TaxID=128206 RepID=A0ABP1BXG0_9BRYO